MFLNFLIELVEMFCETAINRSAQLRSQAKANPLVPLCPCPPPFSGAIVFNLAQDSTGRSFSDDSAIGLIFYHNFSAAVGFGMLGSPASTPSALRCVLLDASDIVRCVRCC
jgi:hypothetical protein